jgi:DNA-directed RNA polymerase subunit omega
MARVTISDDLKIINNKYELSMLASQRVRDLNGGEKPIVSVESNEKPGVTALREIAGGQLSVDDLRREFVQSYKKVQVVDENTETLETNVVVPELKELDDELSGVSAIKQEISDDEGKEDLPESDEK